MRWPILLVMVIVGVLALAGAVFYPAYFYKSDVQTYYLAGFIFVQVSIFLLTDSNESGTNQRSKLL